MTYQRIGCRLSFGLSVALAVLAGKYMARIYDRQPTFTDFLAPWEDRLLRLWQINPERPMGWAACTPITLATAYVQIPRIAQVRGIPAERLRHLVAQHAKKPWLGPFRAPRINALSVNLALHALP